MIESKVSHLHKRNVAIIALLLITILSSLLFALARDSVQIDRRGDSALYEQIMGNTANGLGSVSDVFNNTQDFIEKRYAFLSLRELMTEERLLTTPGSDSRSILGFHAYYIVYLVAPITKLLGLSLGAHFLHALSYFLMSAVAAVWVFRTRASPLLSLVAMLCIVGSPYFLIGLLGQFYPDRLFVLFGFLTLLVAYKNKKGGFAALFIMVILSCSLGERAALVLGMGLIFVGLSKFKEGARAWCVIVALGIGSIIFSYVTKTFWLENLYYSSFLPGNIDELIYRFSRPDFVERSLRLIVAASPFLMLSLFNRWIFCFGIVSILPNFLGDIGGAEKIGFATHYFSYMYPSLVFCALVGLDSAASRGVEGRAIRRIVSIFCICATFATLSVEAAKNNLPLGSYKTIAANFTASLTGQPNGKKIRTDVVGSLENFKLVGTDELGFALLNETHKIRVFPVDTRSVDALFIPCHWVDSLGGGPVSDEWLIGLGFSVEPQSRHESISYCVFARE